MHQVDEAANILEQARPALWKRMNTKFINNPGTHVGFKYVAVTLASAIIDNEHDKLPDLSNNLGACAAILEKYNFPTYYVSKPLLESMSHTHPPKEMKWDDVFLPFDGMIFMVPMNTIFEQPSNKQIVMLGICKFKANSEVKIPDTKMTVNMKGPEDRISIFWVVQEDLVTQDCTFPVSQPLEPSAGWIEEQTQKYLDFNGMKDAGADSNFSSYLAGIVANLILVMQARKPLVEPGQSQLKVLKSGVPIYSPTYIGRKYTIIRQVDRPTESTGMRFTELGWRSGYMRTQHFGKQNAQSKIILVDPYIAYTKGLAPK